MKIALAIIFSLLVIMTITNPDTDSHKKVLKDEFLTAVNSKYASKLESADGFEALGMAMGQSLVEPMVNMMVDKMVSVDNYFVFSLTNATIDANTKTIGVGMLGNVYIFDEVKEKLHEIE